MKSMTGYGSAEGKVGKGVVFAEIRGINSRFLDVICKLPIPLYPLDPKIRKLIQNNIIRGKVEVFVKDRVSIGETTELDVNVNLVRQYKNCMSKINNLLGVKASSHLLEVVDMKDLVISRERPLNAEHLWGQIERVVLQAIKKFDDMRLNEGNALRKDQTSRLLSFEQLTNKITKAVTLRSSKYRDKMMKGFNSDSGGTQANERLTQEISAVSDRMDVTEELVRLKSHIRQYRGLLGTKGAVGRQIDFLLQEMHREVNTLGSKACDKDVSPLIVEAKSDLEKLREQVQNIE